jgi:hypothetical protein
MTGGCGGATGGSPVCVVSARPQFWLAAITNANVTGMVALIPHTAPTTTANASLDKRLPTMTANAIANATPPIVMLFRILFSSIKSGESNCERRLPNSFDPS